MHNPDQAAPIQNVALAYPASTSAFSQISYKSTGLSFQLLFLYLTVLSTIIKLIRVVHVEITNTVLISSKFLFVTICVNEN